MKNKIVDLIENSDLPRIKKSISIGIIERAIEKERIYNEDRELVKSVMYDKGKLNEIVISTDEVKIYTVSSTDEWDIKYPYRSIYKDADGVWRIVNTVSPTLDLAFITYLEYKHLNSTSNFTNFAIKMLEIKLEY